MPYISLLILTFLNRCISVKTSLINTKLWNLVNFVVLFLTMWINTYLVLHGLKSGNGWGTYTPFLTQIRHNYIFITLIIHISAGYWPCVRWRWLNIGQVLFCVCVHGPKAYISSYYGFGNIFLAGPAGSPEQARYRHIVCLCSQSRHRIWFILPTRVIQPAEIGDVYQSQVVRCLSVNVLSL